MHAPDGYSSRCVYICLSVCYHIFGDIVHLFKSSTQILDSVYRNKHKIKYLKFHGKILFSIISSNLVLIEMEILLLIMELRSKHKTVQKCG